jgi:hypothetical protein
VRIAPEARKHDVNDEDILHAVRNRMFQAVGTDDLAIYIGPARNAALLENRRSRSRQRRSRRDPR